MIEKWEYEDMAYRTASYTMTMMLRVLRAVAPWCAILAAVNLSAQSIRTNDQRLHEEAYRRTSGTEQTPDVTSSQEGFAVVWSEQRPDFSYDVLVRRVDERGVPFGATIRCNETPLSTAYSRPRIAWGSPQGGIGDRQGRYLVVWQETDSGGLPDRISGRFINRDGVPSGPTFRLDVAPFGGRGADPAVAAIPGTSDFMVAWIDRIAGGRIVAAAVGNGGPQTPYLVADTTTMITRTGTAIDVGGPLDDVVVAWSESDPFVFGVRRVVGRIHGRNGTPLTPLFQVDSLVPVAFTPAITVAGDGTFVVAYETVIQGRWEVRAQRFDESAVKIDQPMVPAMGLGGGGAPDVIAHVGRGADGYGGTLIWREPIPGEPEGRLRLQGFDGRGRLDPASLLVDSSSNRVGAPISVAGIGIGNTNPSPTRVFAVWPEWSSAGMTLRGRSVQSGSPLSAIMTIDNDSGGAAQRSPAIDAAADGFHVVAFQDDRTGPGQIRVTRMAFDGTASGPDRSVSDSIDGVDRSDPDLLVRDDHSFVAVWTEGAGFEGSAIQYRLFDPSGEPVGSIAEVSAEAGVDRPAITGDAGDGFVVVWRSRQGIRGRRFDSDGRARSASFDIDDDTSGAMFTGPDVATTPDGGFIVVWSDDRNGHYDIMGRAYGPTGVSSGPDRSVNDLFPGDTTQQIWPSIDVAPDGTAAVVWLDYRSSTSAAEVRARRFDGGVPTGGAIDVSDRATPARGLCLECREEPPTVSAAKASSSAGVDRSFVFAWSTRLNDDNDVVARFYRSIDGPAPPPLIETSAPTGSRQRSPVLARDADGGLYLAWEDDRRIDPDNWDVWGRIVEWRGGFSGVDREPERESLCSISPNPAPGIGVLHVDLPHDGTVIVRFYGSDGREALRRDIGAMSKGEGRILLDFTLLAGSVYLIEVELDGRRCASTMVMKK